MAEQTLAHPPAAAPRQSGPYWTVPPQRLAPLPPYAAGREPSLPRPARSGRRLGPVVALLTGPAVLAGLVAGALLLLGPTTLDDAAIESEIIRITGEQAGVAPVDVACPDDVPAQVGGTFSCGAVLDGRAVAYSVRQDDGDGGVTISSAGFVVLARVEADLVRQLHDRADFAATAACGPAGRRIVVGGPGTTIDCTVSAAADPTDSARVVGVVTDDAGTVTFESGG